MAFFFQCFRPDLPKNTLWNNFQTHETFITEMDICYLMKISPWELQIFLWQRPPPLPCQLTTFFVNSNLSTNCGPHFKPLLSYPEMCIRSPIYLGLKCGFIKNKLKEQRKDTFCTQKSLRFYGSKSTNCTFRLIVSCYEIDKKLEMFSLDLKYWLNSKA